MRGGGGGGGRLDQLPLLRVQDLVERPLQAPAAPVHPGAGHRGQPRPPRLRGHGAGQRSDQLPGARHDEGVPHHHTAVRTQDGCV